jgi:hypothetical protein
MRVAAVVASGRRWLRAMVTPRRSRRLLVTLLVLAFALVVATTTAVLVLRDHSRTAVGPEPAATPTQSVRLNLRTDVGRDAPFLASFDARALAAGAAVDAISAIDRPRFDAPDDATLMLPEDLVVSVEVNGDARAYPEKLLSLHEVVNDIVGGSPLAVVWCPLCRTATAFERRISGRLLTFGVSGLLYHRNIVLFDRETRSLWSQLLGGAVTGKLRGTKLRHVPVRHETFAHWRARHPNGKVLSVADDTEARRFTEPFESGTIWGPESSDQPYTSYWAKVANLYRGRAAGIPDRALVLGLLARDRAVAYPLNRIEERGLVEDEVDGVPVLLVVSDRQALSASVFSRVFNGRVLTFRLAGRGLVDRETGTRWSLDGEGVAGALAGRRLDLIPATTSYWFAWRAVHPETIVRGLGRQ